MSVDDMLAQEFRRRVGISNIVIAYRNNKLWIIKLLSHDITDRQFLFDSFFSDVGSENYHLLDGFIPEDGINFIPGIGPAA